MSVGQNKEKNIPTFALRKWVNVGCAAKCVTSDLQSIYSSDRTTLFAGEAADCLNWAPEGNWKARTDLVLDNGVPDVLCELTNGLHVSVVFPVTSRI